MKIFDNVMFGQKAFILDESKRILILKRRNSDVHNNCWDIPGGRVEHGQSLYDALEREIKEEVNLDLDSVILNLGSSTFIGATNGNPLFHRAFFLCKASGEVQISEEHSEYKWIGLSEIENYSFQPDPDFNAALRKLVEIVPKLDLSNNYSVLG